MLQCWTKYLYKASCMSYCRCNILLQHRGVLVLYKASISTVWGKQTQVSATHMITGTDAKCFARYMLNRNFIKQCYIHWRIRYVLCQIPQAVETCVNILQYWICSDRLFCLHKRILPDECKPMFLPACSSYLVNNNTV